ncbi:Uncharacterised protein [Mycobacteroides abscessus subsp. abscessus]|uniref:hypothetical protein n=1 Tax=Mycobacteroides abscessus TaxID=36809 RepID=UPI0009267CF3|nr:hypothetical protein [Mycobacteroides abscessus]SHX67692.1 Uncharacterised protein [Mycobacteroides abscessus subsp. abscessus]SIC58806.1 Uncharacterised protein [Mycobacteroides abscessus subsp. abscessus]SKK19527.1 Uncharacterised protein [Mycobacteroides abscessus subsp. abscessus]SKP49605.1 Uncharacterised protein [Mycobacteroides abscessus subsp. abscessus]SKR42313.1 Uncharacterised protein [Mycobacteroides abscessus subsp. abscessus]
MSFFTTEEQVQNLMRNMQDAHFYREATRDYLRFVLQSGSWRDYRTPNGVRVQHERFIDFVDRLHPFGMSTVTHTVTVAELRVLAAGDRRLTVLLDIALGTVTDPTAEASLIAGDLRRRLSPEVLAALAAELAA